MKTINGWKMYDDVAEAAKAAEPWDRYAPAWVQDGGCVYATKEINGHTFHALIPRCDFEDWGFKAGEPAFTVYRNRYDGDAASTEWHADGAMAAPDVIGMSIFVCWLDHYAADIAALKPVLGFQCAVNQWED